MTSIAQDLIDRIASLSEELSRVRHQRDEAELNENDVRREVLEADDEEVRQLRDDLYVARKQALASNEALLTTLNGQPNKSFAFTADLPWHVVALIPEAAPGFASNKIAAIKKLRVETNCGLKEARDRVVEFVQQVGRMALNRGTDSRLE